MYRITASGLGSVTSPGPDCFYHTKAEVPCPEGYATRMTGTRTAPAFFCCPEPGTVPLTLEALNAWRAKVYGLPTTQLVPVSSLPPQVPATLPVPAEVPAGVDTPAAVPLAPAKRAATGRKRDVVEWIQIGSAVTLLAAVGLLVVGSVVRYRDEKARNV